MNPGREAHDRQTASPAGSSWRTTAAALLWCAGVFAVYLSNGREIASGDAVPAKFLIGALLRGDGFYLDRYRDGLFKPWSHPQLPYYLRMVDDHYVSAYPIAPTLVAMPFAIPQVLGRDWTDRGWEKRDPDWYDTITKRSSAAIVALADLALLAVLLRLGLRRAAWVAATAAALGSTLWAIASQTLWQHGPAALMLTLTVLLLMGESPSRLRLLGAGFTAALLVSSRPIDLAFAVVTAVWVAVRHPRGLLWFMAAPLVIGAALISYNRAYLGTAAGYYSQFEATLFATPWQVGLQGTLVSPSRGLFIFTPWTLVAFAYLPFAFYRLRRAPLLPWLIAALGAHALLISTFSVWWAGFSYGPRYWTEVIPLLAIVLGLALDWASARCRPVLWISLALIAVSIGVQFLGAEVYPSGWEVIPNDVDQNRQRLWDWTDSELTRCLFQSKAYRWVTGRSEEYRIPPGLSGNDALVGSNTADRAATVPKMEGYLERVFPKKIEGWAWDPRRPDTPIAVELYDGENFLVTVVANKPRRDLVEAGKGNGRHVFLIPTPASLKDGEIHEIHAKIAGFGIELNWSPQDLVCPKAESRSPSAPNGAFH